MVNAARNRSKELPPAVAMTPMGAAAVPAGSAAYGYPATLPPPGQQVVYTQPGGVYPAGGVGSGASPWLAGGAGLLGGYALGSTLGGHHHHGGDWGGGGGYYGGGGGGGGGDFAASSDFGGGDGGGGDFAADS